MFKTLSQDLMRIFPKPTNLKTGIWNHFTSNGVITSNIKFDIFYKECLDISRKTPIDRYYSQVNLQFGNKLYTEESFYFNNGFNNKENYYDYKLYENNKPINYSQINNLVFKKINTYIFVNDLEKIVNNFKHYYYGRKLLPDEKDIICSKFISFCDELESSVITRHIGSKSKDLIRIDKYEVPSIAKEYNRIQPVIRDWSKLTGRDILIDRMYNIYLDFLLIG